MCDDVVNVHFEENRRRQGLTFKAASDDEQQVDKSRKGSVDFRILPLVQEINGTPDFFTTSSCSGRAILFTHDVASPSVTNERFLGLEESNTEEARSAGTKLETITKTRKKGCQWLYVTHDEAKQEEFLEAWARLENHADVTFKIEPSIFHIQCRNLRMAKKLVHLGTESGFRNSGVVIGKDNKITVAIRSAIGMEVPLKKVMPEPIVSESLLQLLLTTGNEKLRESWRRTEKLIGKVQQLNE